MARMIGATRFLRVAALATCAALASGAAVAADFYKDKVVTLYVGFSAGGGYDVYARLIAQHMGRHLPGSPSIVVKNMEGAGGLLLANWLYAVAPKDGTVFATFARGTPFDPLMGNSGAQFSGPAAFSYVGSANDEVSVCVSWRGSGVARYDDLLSKELIVGGFGPDTESEQHVKVMDGVLGTKLKLVKGYAGGSAVTLAMQRGEVQGRCGWSWTGVRSGFQNELRDGTMSVLVQNSLGKHPDLPDTPLIMDLAKNEQQANMLRLVFAPQKMGRPFMAPPNIPAERLSELQQAFDDTMKDPEFLAMAQKAQLEISPITGQAMRRLVEDIYETPKDLALATGAMMR
jgi:tripartite-type tricarboxylate transporter receptor subunit TctC